MRNIIQKFRQTSIVFKEPGFLYEKLKTLTRSNSHRVQYFLLKIRTRFLLTNVYLSVCSRFFKFNLDLELFAKIRKHLVSTHWFFTFINTSRSKLNKKIPNILLQTLLNVCKISAKKYYTLW